MSGVFTIMTLSGFAKNVSATCMLITIVSGFSFFAVAFGNSSENSANDYLLLEESSSRKPVDLTPYIEYLEDRDSSLTFAQISPYAAQASSAEMEYSFAPAPGWLLPAFAEGSICWIRFRCASRMADKGLPPSLYVTWPWLQDAKIYYYNDSGTELFTREISRGSGETLFFTLPGLTEKPRWIYLRLRGDLTLSLPLYIMSLENYQGHHSRLMLFYGIAYGVIVLLLVFNLYIFIKTRDKHHLWYALYLIFFGIYFTGNAYSINHMLFGLDAKWLCFLSLQGLPLMLFSAAAFSRYFLRTRENAAVPDRILSVFAWVSLAAFLAALPGRSGYSRRVIISWAVSRRCFFWQSASGAGARV